MAIKLILLMLIFIASINAQKSTTIFEIRKRHPNWDFSVPIGNLTVNILSNFQTVQSHIDSSSSELISSSDFQDNNPIIIEFVPIRSDSESYRSRVFMTSVDEIKTQPHGEKISIILGSDSKDININSINYVQTRDRIGQIFTEQVKMKEEETELFKYEQAAKKSQVQNQSFFSKYKWPLIIGGVVIYVMMTVDPQKTGAAAAAQR